MQKECKLVKTKLSPYRTPFDPGPPKTMATKQGKTNEKNGKKEYPLIDL